MKNAPFIFILGRKPLLSLAELLGQFSEKEIISIRPKTFIVKPKGGLKHPQEFLNTLGGTIRIIETFHRTQKPDMKKLEKEMPKWLPILKKYFNERFKKRKSKIHFGINMYNFPHPREIFLKKLLNNLKNALKDTGLKVRFVNKNFKNIQSVVTNKEKLISDKGCEINIVIDEKYTYFTKTVAVQNVDKYSERDYGKPCRDPKSGMLPPKLGQMLIGFARFDEKGRPNKINYIYDPFCGTGTILMEGILQGLHVAGSDIDKNAALYSRKNVDWLKKTYVINATLKCKISTLDATKLTNKAMLEAFGVKRMPNFAIVTEPYLGPPFFKFPKMEKLETHMKYLDELYVSFFKKLNEIIPKGTIIIFVMPAFRDRTRDIRMSKTVEKIKPLGYSVIDLIPEKIAKAHKIEKPKTPSLLYERKGQVVIREIYKFVRT